MQAIDRPRAKSQGSLDVYRLGVLAAVLLGLETRTPTLHGARVEDIDGHVFMVAPSLRIDAPDGSTTIQEAADFLKQNKLISFDRVDGELRVGHGEHLKNLYGTAEGGNTDGGVK
jgi:hypothetical protein